MKQKWTRLLWIPVALLLAVFSYFAICAYLNIVSLDVQNADIRDVIRKIEWQTWRSILVHRDVRGSVTLKVRHAPLEEVLDLLGQQTGTRWFSVYPLYISGRSLEEFKQAVRGEVAIERTGWTNLDLFLGERLRPSPMADKTTRTDPVTLNFTNRDLHIAILALSRFGNVSIVPADGTDGKVSMNVDRAPMKKAVQVLAKGIQRKSSRYYTLQAIPRPPMDFAQGEGPDELFPPPGLGDGPPPMPGMEPGAMPPMPPPGMMPPPPPPTKEQEQRRESNYLAIVNILPPAQRTRLEMEHKVHESLREKSPEEAQAIIQQISASSSTSTSTSSSSSSETEQRNQGLRTTTPEQRVTIDRMKANSGTPKR